MRTISTLFIMLLFVIMSAPTDLLAAPDQYPGDTSIYGGVVSQVQPNVLIVLDTTGSMSDLVIASQTPYDPNTIYPDLYNCGTYGNSSCATNAVYNYTSRSVLNTDVNNVVTSCAGQNPMQILKTYGTYNGRKLKTNGTCNSTGTASYALGNYFNWLDGPSTVYDSKINIAKTVIANLLNSTTGVNFGVLRYDTSNGKKFFTTSVSGQTYTTTVKNMEDIFTGTTTNKAALIQAVSGLSLGGATPIGEALFESMRYFQGAESAFGSTVGVTAGKYTSPIIASCQKNYLILVTDGMSNSDYSSKLKTICNQGDCDSDGVEPGNLNHSADDVAKYMFDTDLSSTYDGKQNVTTFTIGFGAIGADATAVNLLNRAADSNHGRGKAYLASDQAGLATSLTQIVSSVLEVNSSFVAPVVPVSPDNRTASASRMYLGLFKPASGNCWSGNLKKYGLDSKGYLIDQNDAFATYLDKINNTTKLLIPDKRDDRTGASLDLNASDGSFISGTKSYWNTESDAGQVEMGGVGEQLLSRPTARKIYTYLGTNTALADASNSFVSSNAAISATTLAVADSATRDSLISYVQGFDAYCENTTLSSPCASAKRDWILGDILHSKPVVLNYSKYTFDKLGNNEKNCDINKSIMFVGANDGMLHAFQDCDGSELWAFIPPELLPNLQYIRNANHTTFLDSTVTMYIYDKPDSSKHVNGNIVAAEGDKAVILFGQRRGGGSNISPSSGVYYALDVTDPANPQFLGKISNATAGYSEMAETWSDPKIAKVKVDGAFKIAAIFGAGYDNLNEDSRYGATQTFLGTGAVVTGNTGAGAITSLGANAPLNPRGRGIYIAEVASLNPTTLAPNFANFGKQIWRYTFAENAAMTSSIPAELALLDTEAAGYINRIYAVDTAANLWRFDIGTRKVGDSTVTSSRDTWTGKKIFASNPGSDGTTGRKAFYKPDVTLEIGYDMVLFGTGDREHPQNKNVLDRIYGLKVRDADVASTVVQTETTGPNGISLFDVTTDQLQNVSIANTGTATNPTPGSEAYIYKQLKDTNGWYIKLDESGSEGEKVLSTPIVYAKQMFLTTYVPQTLPNPDPCQPSNLGYSQTYILGHLTGAAVQGLDATNDQTFSGSNKADIVSAKNTITNNGKNNAALGSTISGGGITSVVNLKRSDRHTTGGAGIASSPVVTPGLGVMINEGDKIVTQTTAKGGLVIPLYWRQK